MKVLVVSLYSQISCHFAADLEIIENHSKNSDDVSILSCLGSLPACFVNQAHISTHCDECVSARNTGLSLTGYNFVDSDYRKYLSEEEIVEAKLLEGIVFQNKGDLKEFVKDFDVGEGSLSTLISLMFDPAPTERIIKLGGKFVSASWLIYCAVKRYVQIEKPEIVYVFNGRWAIPRAVVRACQHANVKYITHDRGHDHNHYMLYENCIPHDRTAHFKRILEQWKNEPDLNLKEKKATDFYHNRRGGIIQNWKSFTNTQQSKLLPESWREDRYNIAIYNSSENEFEVIGKEWKNPFFKNQAKGIKYILEQFESRDIKPETVFIYLRIHPNLLGRRELDNLLKFSSPLIEVIAPDSKIDSYALLDACDKVVTFGSTMGVEATFWGKPSILLGKSGYDELDIAYIPQSKEEIFDLLLDRNIKAKAKLGAMKYGYYLQTYGIPFKYWKPKDGDLYEGTYKGVELRPKQSELKKRLRSRILDESGYTGLVKYYLARTRGVFKD